MPTNKPFWEAPWKSFQSPPENSELDWKPSESANSVKSPARTRSGNEAKTLEILTKWKTTRWRLRHRPLGGSCCLRFVYSESLPSDSESFPADSENFPRGLPKRACFLGRAIDNPAPKGHRKRSPIWVGRVIGPPSGLVGSSGTLRTPEMAPHLDVPVDFCRFWHQTDRKLTKINTTWSKRLEISMRVQP